jgi:hypothetical protein
LLESIPQLPKYSAPYGAYFVKPEMTREERLQDFTACGAGNPAEFCRVVADRPQLFADCKTRCILTPCFTEEEEKEAEKVAKITGEFYDMPNKNGFFILLKKLRACMASKGYHSVSRWECEGDQEYQPRCMWP